ncbi:(2Fe-2S) ferredoxin domain-containing protein [Desulfosarcina cetonica]|uniref:(2Fe-2S) ferredoxin domain-containing protein n=1 Tax=Desulfosarcina cetonica TaxID=90730 RepID=UPI001C477087|nr:NAD(P)H-dependent oxidoreductase subunit E [Desulfosarcina cetonica]
MQRINSAAELDARRKEILSGKDPDKPAIAVCSGAGCAGLSNGRVIAALEKELDAQGLADKVDLRATGCHGLCELGPNVVIYPEEIYYTQVKPEDVADIVKETVLGKKVVDRLVYTDPASGEKAVHLNEIPFYKYQNRNLIGNNTRIDPSSIDDYIGIGGYAALAKALFEMKPEAVLDEVKTANLRGRGGGGFPAGLKWETTRNAEAQEKYVIVNGHEGEPGAFMDRAVFTGNPHLVIEGLIIGAYAIGAIRDSSTPAMTQSC